MNRRHFLSFAAGAGPLLAAAGEIPPAPLGKAVLIRAGDSVVGERMHLGDRSILDVKLGGEGENVPLIIEQSELRRFGPPRHLHFRQDEWFYAVKGTYQVEVGEEKFELRPGDFLFAPRGVPHAWKHLEEEPGRLIVGFEPAGTMLSFFRKFTHGGVLAAPSELPALFSEHGMKLLGPPLA